MKYVVMRKAVLMEDEGNPHCIGVRDTKEEAEKLIESMLTPKYWSRGDFYIAEASA